MGIPTHPPPSYLMLEPTESDYEESEKEEQVRQPIAVYRLLVEFSDSEIEATSVVSVQPI